MEDITVEKILWVLGGAAVLIVLVSLLALQTLGFFWVVGKTDDLPSVRAIATIAVDEIVESGALTATAETDEPLFQNRSIVITTAINEQTSRKVVRQLFHLSSADPASPIDLYLSSPGGWGGSAFTILDAMQRVDSTVNTHALGMCYSSCALILAGATGQRTAAANAIIMVHANIDASSEPFSFDSIYQDKYESFWRNHSAVPDDWFPMTADREYFLTAKQAVDYEIIDEIVRRRE